MPKFTFTITSENETWLREQNRKKGDMSRILNSLMEKQKHPDWKSLDDLAKACKEPVNHKEMRRWKAKKEKQREK